MTTDDALDRAAQALERHVGMRLDGSGRARLGRVLDGAATAAGTSTATLVARIEDGGADLADIVDGVTIQETGWFRDPAWWRRIQGEILPRLTRAAGRRTPVVLWSAGCATGQEAYSLAIACEEAGVADVRVVASDVSRPATAATAAGRYSDRGLRGLSAERRDRWLRRDGADWVVRDELRARVDVHRHNLVTTPPPIAEGTCALVLCRYVLIYLTPEVARAFADRIRRVLEPDGVLVIGAAESLWHVTDAFAVSSDGDASVYRPRGREGAGAVRRPVAAGHDAPVAGRARAAGARRPSSVAGRPAARRGPDAAREAASPPPAPDPGRPPRPGSPPPAAPAAPAAPPALARDPRALALLAEGEAALAARDVPTAVARFRGAAYLAPEDPVAHLQLGLALEAMDDPGATRAFRAAWSALADTDPETLRDALGGYRAEELVHLVAGRIGRAP